MFTFPLVALLIYKISLKANCLESTHQFLIWTGLEGILWIYRWRMMFEIIFRRKLPWEWNVTNTGYITASYITSTHSQLVSSVTVTIDVKLSSLQRPHRIFVSTCNKTKWLSSTEMAFIKCYRPCFSPILLHYIETNVISSWLWFKQYWWAPADFL